MLPIIAAAAAAACCLLLLGVAVVLRRRRKSDGGGESDSTDADGALPMKAVAATEYKNLLRGVAIGEQIGKGNFGQVGLARHMRGVVGVRVAGFSLRVIC